MDREIKWNEVINKLDFAYQPIISANNNKTFGVEALLRNYKEAGFDSIDEIFTKAYQDGYAYELSLNLQKKAIKKFKTIHFYEKLKLFYNIDSRIFKDEKFNVKDFIKYKELTFQNIIFEISEKYCFKGDMSIYNKINELRQFGFNIALDDYGIGYSNLEKLGFLELNIIKIDKIFIQKAVNNEKLTKIMKGFIKVAHSLEIIMLAEGVENKEELNICKILKFDLLQGYFISYPQIDNNCIKDKYLKLLPKI